jgi:hypothetical protein
MSEWRGYWERVRQQRNQMRTARGLPPLPEKRSAAVAAPPATTWDEWPDAGSKNDASGELQAVLEEHSRELDEAKRLLREMTDYAETMEARVIELVAQVEPMAKALLLPKVKTGLLKAFHPDKHPKATDEQRDELNEAMKIITAAYAAAEKLQPSSAE